MRRFRGVAPGVAVSTWVALAFVLIAPPRLHASTWNYLQHEKIEIISRVSPEATREIFSQIYLFPHLLQSFFRADIETNWPIRVVVTTSDREFRELNRSEQRLVVGTFVALPNYDLVVIKHNFATWHQIREIIFHEYTHRLFRSAHFPIWAEEGLAQYFQTIDFDDRYVTQGKFDIEKIRLLGHFGFIKWEEFFQIKTTHSIEDEIRMARFYTQAYLLMQYIMAEANSATRERFIDLMHNRNLRDFSEAQFKEATGMNYRQLHAALRKMTRQRQFKHFRYDVSLLPEVPEVEVRPPTPYEEDLLLGATRAWAKDTDGARQHLLPLLHQNPQDPRPYEELYLLHRVSEDGAAADEAAEAAYQRGSQAPGIRIHLARRRLQEWPRFPQRPFPPDEVASLQQLLAPVLQLDSNHRLAWRMLLKATGYSLLRPAPSDLPILEHGYRVLRDDPESRLSYAVLLSKIGRRDEGRSIVEDVLATADLSGHEEMEAHISWLLEVVFP